MENQIVWRIINKSNGMIEWVFRTKTPLHDEKFCDEFMSHIPESGGDHMFGSWEVRPVDGCLQHIFTYDRKNGHHIRVIELVEY